MNVTRSSRVSSHRPRKHVRLRLRLGHASRGQGLVEYGLLLLLVALVAVGAVTLFGQKTSATYSRIECRVNQAQTQVACPSGGN